MRNSRAFVTTFDDPGNIIDDATEVYGAHADTDFDDVTGDLFACCPMQPGAGCEYQTQCGVTRCLHCNTVVAV